MILNTGDVPNIFAADEKADVIEKMQGVARLEVRYDANMKTLLLCYQTIVMSTRTSLNLSK